MRLKEIKPGMVIHCKNDDDKKALLEEAERLGYRWGSTANLPTSMAIDDFGSTIHFYEKNEFTDFKHITWSEKTEGVTEFSDLILPELSAEETLRIFGAICAGGCCSRCPFDIIKYDSDCPTFLLEHYKEAAEICAQWKSDHEKKEPEIEWVYRVFGAENYGEKFFQTEEEAIKRCEELAKSQKTKQYARYERVCRVKAVG